MQSIKSLRVQELGLKTKYHKISYSSANPYNKRWEFKWKHSYYTYPRDGKEHTNVKKPQDSWDSVPLFYAYFQDFMFRWVPGMQTWWDRRHRMFDPFSVYFLPGTSLFFYQFTHISLGFKICAAMPWFLLYVRIRDRCLDPDFKETYLRDILYSNPEVTKYFSEETIHVLDYDCEYDKGFPDKDKFPEYQNKVYRFFNTDTSCTTGHFTFGDVESGATMEMKFKTMPSHGRFRYQVGEPFYFYSIVADIKTADGKFKQVKIVDEEETLKRMRPFLFLI